MQARASSRTAEATAAIRACHLAHDRVHLFVDPYAEHLTSRLWRAVCRSRLLHGLVVRGVLAALRPVHGWILVRDRVTEDALDAFLAGGGTQFVLLGAGFDTTALRRATPDGDLRVFEVDHPATQAVKLARIARLGIDPSRCGLEPVAIDFEHEGLVAGLARSSFEPARPALFAWQGVVYYLSAAAIRRTLEDIAALAAPGSELMFDFLLPRGDLGPSRGRVQALADRFTARLGERYVSYHSPHEIEVLLDACGFEVLSLRLDRELERDHVRAHGVELPVMEGFGIVHARRRTA